MAGKEPYEDLGRRDGPLAERERQGSTAVGEGIAIPHGKLNAAGAVIRGTEVLIASGDTVLRPGDEMFIACLQESLRDVEKLFS